MDTYQSKFNAISNQPWNEVHVDLIGPWMILQCPSKRPNLSTTSDIKQPVQVLALTMIDPSTNLLKLIVVLDKESHTVAHAFDHSWFCHGNQIHQN
jgi:hypothetical protein